MQQYRLQLSKVLLLSFTIFGKNICLGSCVLHDVVITRFGHCVKLASKPGTLPGGLAVPRVRMCLTQTISCCLLHVWKGISGQRSYECASENARLKKKTGKAHFSPQEVKIAALIVLLCQTNGSVYCQKGKERKSKSKSHIWQMRTSKSLAFLLEKWAWMTVEWLSDFLWND